MSLFEEVLLKLLLAEVFAVGLPLLQNFCHLITNSKN